jgi:hypothetical protein
VSFRTTIECHVPVEVEIDREGNLTLHGYDADYDLAFTVMSGGEPSLCQNILGRWEEFPYSVIEFDLGVSFPVLRSLMLDLIEYTVRTGVLDWAYPDSLYTEDLVARYSAIVDRIIETGRGIVGRTMFKGEGREVIGRLYKEYRSAEQDLGQLMSIYDLATQPTTETLECFGNAIARTCRGLGDSYLGSGGMALVAQSIRQATYPRYMGMGHKPDQVRKVDSRLSKWFISRFVDAMEEWQLGQPWPRIEEAP